MGDAFTASNPDAKVTFNFAGSGDLVTQITQGAPADVFASANQKQMDVVITAGEIMSGAERTFARNRLVVVYPRDNPAKLAALKDLANPGVKIVLANKSVPVGAYALDFLGKASKLPEYTAEFSPTVVKNVVSYEENVKAVLSKITLGEADAGIVYTTDAATVTDGSIGMLDIPDSLNVIASYPIAVTKSAKNADLAQKFFDYVLSPDGQKVLVKYGFIPVTGSATGAAPTAAPLAIGGMVNTPFTLTLDDFNKMNQIEVKATDKGGTEQTFKGVPIAALLEQAGVKSGATKVVFTGGDGYTAEVTVADLAADKEAIVTADANGAFRNIIPTMMPMVWVKGLVKLDIQ
jgi:molybdate transport system substrate-binding protein